MNEIEEIEQMTSGEAYRTAAFVKSETQSGSIAIRPITLSSFIRLQLCGFFDESRPEVERLALFIFLHAAPEEEVRRARQTREGLCLAAYDFADATFQTHEHLAEHADRMTEEMNAYVASLPKNNAARDGEGAEKKSKKPGRAG